MPGDNGDPTADEVVRYLDEAASRTKGNPPTPGFTPPPPPVRRGPGTGARALVDEAYSHAGMGTAVPEGARLRFLKRGVLAAMRPATSHQVIYNHRLAEAVKALAEDVDQRLAAAQAGLATADLAMQEIADGIERVEARVTDLVDRIGKLEARQRWDRSELATHQSRLDIVLRAAREALPGGMDETQLNTLRRQLDARYEELYRDLENTFRGSRDEIRVLVEEYVKDVLPLSGTGPVVDLGCGRGEWLEVLRDHGVEAYGVDTNEAFVAAGTERGLDVRHGDALRHLHEVPESSLAAVTGFHLAEHVTLDGLVDLVDSALRALRPGGLLILETPNPTNVTVGAAAFYIDPTHLKPLHPQFLEFLVLERGFVDAELRFLHPTDTPPLELPAIEGVDTSRVQAALDRLNWALAGPQDYAVLARKASPPSA
jgi:O-antigen chain-terminating methyltransferase